MSRFVITGMPRTGTAWLSVFLTYRDTVCRHDLFSAEGVSAGARRLEEDVFGAYGVADCGAVVCLERVRARWPDAQWVVLTRDAEECRDSVRRAFGFDHDLTEHARLVGAAVSALGASALVVPFEQVFDRADEIAAHCDIRWRPDGARTEELRRMNIQVRPQALFDRLRTTILREDLWELQSQPQPP